MKTCFLSVPALLLALVLGAIPEAQAREDSRFVVEDAQGLYLAGDGLRAVDTTDGSTRWRALPGVQVFAPLLLEDRLLVGSTQGLYAVARETGRILWHRLADAVIYTPVSHRGRLYAGALDGRLRAFSPKDGELLWERALEGWVYTPAALGDQLVTGGSASRLWSLDWKTGARNWQLALDQQLVHRPVAARDGVLVTTFAGTLSHYSPQGRLRWRKDDGVASLSPLVHGDEVITSGLDGSLRLRQLADGALLAEAEIQGRLMRPPLLAGDRLLLLSEAGDLGVFSLAQRRFLLRRQLAPTDTRLPLRREGEFHLLDVRRGVTSPLVEASDS